MTPENSAKLDEKFLQMERVRATANRLGHRGKRETWNQNWARIEKLTKRAHDAYERIYHDCHWPENYMD